MGLRQKPLIRQIRHDVTNTGRTGRLLVQPRECARTDRFPGFDVGAHDRGEDVLVSRFERRVRAHSLPILFARYATVNERFNADKAVSASLVSSHFTNCIVKV